MSLLYRVTLAFLLLLILAVSACTGAVSSDAPKPPSNDIRVTTEAPDILSLAKAFHGVCNGSAEFGHCGCTINGLRASCDAALNCLAAGFCELEAQAHSSKSVAAKSDPYRRIAQALKPYCSNPAEYWRCDCSIDGVKANCGIAQQCLQAGFCEVVRPG